LPLEEELLLLFVKGLPQYLILLGKLLLELHTSFSLLLLELRFPGLLLAFNLLLLDEQLLLHGLSSLLLLLLELFELFSGLFALLFLDQNELRLPLLFFHSFDLCLGRVKVDGHAVGFNLGIRVVVADDLIQSGDVIGDTRVEKPVQGQDIYLVWLQATLLLLDLDLVLLDQSLLHGILKEEHGP
jgi:hypothetical protein